MTNGNEPVKKRVKKTTPIKYPPKYKVIFMNDSNTPAKFVHIILVVIFNKSEDDAQRLVTEIHETGSSVIAIYTKEIAATKKRLTDINSEKNGYPLVCELELVE